MITVWLYPAWLPFFFLSPFTLWTWFVLDTGVSRFWKDWRWYSPCPHSRRKKWPSGSRTIGCCKMDGLCIHTKHKDGNSWKADASILYAGSIHRAGANWQLLIYMGCGTRHHTITFLKRTKYLWHSINKTNEIYSSPYTEVYQLGNHSKRGTCSPGLVMTSQILGLLALMVPTLSSVVCIKLPEKHPHIMWE